MLSTNCRPSFSNPSSLLAAVAGVAKTPKPEVGSNVAAGLDQPSRVRADFAVQVSMGFARLAFLGQCLPTA